MALTEKDRGLSKEFHERMLKRWPGSVDGTGFTSLALHKLLDDDKVDTTWFVVKGTQITRVISSTGREYTSEIPSTKTRPAMERRYPVMMNKLEKLIRDGWCETPTEAREVTKESLSKPMLFKKFLEHRDKVVYPCVCQVKYDGVRAMWDSKAQTLRSRGGKIYNIPHITDVLKGGLFSDLDGEIAYEDIRILPEVIHGVSHADKDLVFYIFDNLANPSAPYRDRLGYLMKNIHYFYGTPMRIAQTKICSTVLEVIEYYNEMVLLGHEGIMVKNLSVPYYYGKRTADHLKYKQEFEAEFTITSVTHDPHPDGDLVAFNCITNDERMIFKVTPAWTHEERRSIATNPLRYGLVGQKMLLEYRAVSKDGIPIHAVGKTSYGDCVKIIS